MHKLGALPIAAIIFVASAASAQQPPYTAPSAASGSVSTAKPVPTEKLICRTEETTGSRFSKKVCHTKSDWNAISADGAAYLEAGRRPQEPR
jgi:hypothetical protein